MSTHTKRPTLGTFSIKKHPSKVRQFQLKRGSIERKKIQQEAPKGRWINGFGPRFLVGK